MQSFTETYDRTLRLVGALESLGAGPGSRVAIAAANGPWYFELYFAACEGGFVELPINARFTQAEQVRYLSRVRPEIVLTTPDLAPLVASLAHQVPSIRHIIGIGDGHGCPLDYESLLSRASIDERPLRDVDDLVLISPTSGTSGEAKAVMHTQRTTASGYQPLIERFSVDGSSHMVTGLAMYFATGYAGWTMTFLAGARHTIMPAYVPATWVELVEDLQATHGFLGPTPAYFIMDAGIDLSRLRSLQHLSLGGSAADPTRLKAFTDALGQRIALQFGMTELGAATAVIGSELVDERGTLLGPHRSIGKALSGLETRVVDNAGHAIDHGSEQPGELEVRGPMVSPGYLDAEQLTRESRHDGWFRTGDTAGIADDGFIYILDRKKDLIVSGGINIAPLEVEQVLGAHPSVLAAGVCGVPDPTFGEAVHASVVLRPGSSASSEELQDWCRRHLASVKKPRSIAFVEALPISSTGKLLRRALRAGLASE